MIERTLLSMSVGERRVVSSEQRAERAARGRGARGRGATAERGAGSKRGERGVTEGRRAGNELRERGVRSREWTERGRTSRQGDGTGQGAERRRLRLAERCRKREKQPRAECCQKKRAVRAKGDEWGGEARTVARTRRRDDTHKSSDTCRSTRACTCGKYYRNRALGLA